MPEAADPRWSMLVGDCRGILDGLPVGIVQTVVTSPPYFRLRDYGMDGQLGNEPTVREYVAAMVGVFSSVRRVLREDGTLWLVVGDSFAAKAGNGFKAKDLHMVPARLAIALQEDGWFLRSDITWAKGNAMPENVRDRPASSHEHVFLLSRSRRYFFDHDAIKEPETMRPQRRLTPRETNAGTKFQALPGHRRPQGSTGGGLRNSRDVWSINTRPFPQAHFATFPPELPRRCIAAGTSQGGCCPGCRTPWGRDAGVPAGWAATCACREPHSVPCLVMDPFGGTGTTADVALSMGRDACLVELNPDYADLARARVGRTPAAAFQW